MISMNSIWTESGELPKFPSLQGDINTEVLIIGGGIAGLMCAYKLSEAGVNYVLVEKDRIFNGVSKNTTAKITFSHGLIYSKIAEQFSLKTAALYYKANEKALLEYMKIAKDIPCDFEIKDNYVYSLRDRSKIDNELKILEKIGCHGEFASETRLPFPVKGALKTENQAQFNPVKFISHISKNLNIYENTKVTEFKEDYILTNRGKIKAEKVVVATHFPINNKHGNYFIKMYQHRSYVIALEKAPDVKGMYVDEAGKGPSLRNAEGMLLLGGGGHRTGKKGGNWHELRELSKKYYPKAKEKYFWATQDCITLDGIPYVGRYSKNIPDFYVITGFNKWGMTSSMVAADLIKDLIKGNINEFTEVFLPSRSIFRPQLAVNAFESITNLLSFSDKRCPHLGCALKWNCDERSWDCPCHGSRFSEEGKLLNNPATDDIE